jgi:glycine oxidase
MAAQDIIRTMDVVVIGAGIIGLLSALRLSQRGHSVGLIERGQPGGEATWASAGILGAQAEAPSPGPMLELCLRSRALYPALAEELGEVGYSRCGVLHLAFDESEEADLRAQQAWQRGAQVVVRAGARFALYFPEDGTVDPRKLSDALRAALERRRVPIERASAVRLRFQGGRLEGVETDRGFHPARTAIVAAGAWSEQIEGAGVPPGVVRPVRGQMIAYDAPSPPSVIFGAGGYAVPRPGRVLIGATVEEAGFDKSVTAQGLDQLRAVAARLFPGLARARPSDHWAGLRPGSRDGLPLLGRTREGVIVATGHFRNGILLAPVTAEIVVQLVENSGRAPPAFDPQRFSRPC